MQKRKISAVLCALFMIGASGAALMPVHASAAEASAAVSQNAVDQVVALVNQERAAQGLNPLKAVPALHQAAEIRSQELVTSFSHTRPDGRSCSTVLNDTGIAWRTTGENIAYGYSSPEAVMEGWMNSAGHRANILNQNFDSIGIGVISQNGVLYWTQIFTGGADFADSYQPEAIPETTVTIPETITEQNTSVPDCKICIGDSCFTCAGTDCTVPQDIFSCLTGNCNTQNILSALNQNCQDGSCNTVQSVLQKLCQ